MALVQPGAMILGVPKSVTAGTKADHGRLRANASDGIRAGTGRLVEVNDQHLRSRALLASTTTAASGAAFSRSAYQMTPGTIIVLNGTSSSGKTSIVRALQDILAEPFVDAGLDRFIWALPRRYLNRPLWDEVLGLATEAGPVGQRLITGMHQSIAALSRAGNNVIADHVLVERRWLEECTRLFSGLPALFVGVRCPVDVLEQREAARADRTLGQARAQFLLVHAHGIYDLEVDTSNASAEACAHQIKQRLEQGSAPDAFRRLLQASGSSAEMISGE